MGKELYNRLFQALILSYCYWRYILKYKSDWSGRQYLSFVYFVCLSVITAYYNTPGVQFVIFIFIHLFIHSFIHSFIFHISFIVIRLFVYSFIHSFITHISFSFICLLIYSFIPLFIGCNLLILSYFHSFIYSFIHLFIHSCIHSLIAIYSFIFV